jgi:hypothetical protein
MKEKIDSPIIVTEAAGSEACIAKIRHQARRNRTLGELSRVAGQGKLQRTSRVCSSARHTVVDAAHSSTSQKEKKKIVHARRALAN